VLLDFGENIMMLNNNLKLGTKKHPTDIKSKYAKASILKGSRIVLIFAATNTGLLLKLTTTDNGLLSGLLELIINMIKLTQKKFRNYDGKSY
jgi:hypothetical protein